MKEHGNNAEARRIWNPMVGDIVRFTGSPHEVCAHNNISPLRVPSGLLPLRGLICKVVKIEVSNAGILLRVMPLDVKKSQHIAGQVVKGTLAERDPLFTKIMMQLDLPKKLFEPSMLSLEEHEDRTS